MTTLIRSLTAMLCVLLSFALHAQPVISSLSAYSGLPGSSVTISGSGFSATPANNVVMFGATRAAVTAASATSLTVTVPVGATTHQVWVTNLATGQMGSSKHTFMPTPVSSGYTPSSVFKNATLITNSASVPQGVPVLADLNNDNIPEIVVGGARSQPAVNVYVNNCTPGQINLSKFSKFSLQIHDGWSGCDVQVGDLDNDGKQDFVINSDSLYIYQNNFSGGALDATSFSRVQAFALIVNMAVLVDINNDGKLDIVVEGNDYSFDDDEIAIFINTSTPGHISFSLAAQFTDYGSGPIAAGDVDGDGKTDIVVSGTYSRIYHNIGTGTTIDASSFEDVLYPGIDEGSSIFTRSCSLQDMDGDGKLDLIIGASPSVLIYKNTSVPGTIDGTTFTLARSIPIVDFSDIYHYKGWQFPIADFNGDGKPDLLVHNLYSTTNYFYGYSFDSSQFEVYYNTSSSGTLSFCADDAALKIPSQTTNTKAFIGDVDGDGLPDILQTDFDQNALIIIQNTLPPPYISGLSAMSGRPGTSLTINGANFNSSPDSNIVWVGQSKATVVAASHSSVTVTIPSGATYGTVAVENVATNATGYYSRNFVPVYDHSMYADGAMGFDAEVDFPQVSDYYNNFAHPVLADMDGDHKLDLAYLYSSHLDFYKNTSTAGSITSSSLSSAGQLPVGGDYISIGDMDGDGQPDVTLGSKSSLAPIQVFRNTNTGGSFSATAFASAPQVYITPQALPGTTYDPGMSFITLGSGDLDGDGRPDIVHRTNGGEGMGFVHNNSYKGSIPDQTLAVSFSPGNMLLPINSTLIDLDNDNKPDLFTAYDRFSPEYVYSPISPRGAVFLNKQSSMLIEYVYYTEYMLPLGIFGYAPITTGSPMPYTASGMADVPGGGYMSFSYADIAYGTSTPADLDGDGRNDILLKMGGNDSLYIVPNVNYADTAFGANSLGAPIFIGMSTSHFASGISRPVYLEDFDGDGRPDLVMLDSFRIAIRRNLSTPHNYSFGSPVYFPLSHNPQYAATGDIDGDGKPDIVASYLEYAPGSDISQTGFMILRNNPGAVPSVTSVCVGATTTLTATPAGGTWTSSNTAVATVGSSSGIVTGASAGTAVISYSSGTTFTVSVNALPLAGTISGTTTICPTATTTLSSTVSGGVWSSGSANATVNAATGVVTGVSAGTAMISYAVSNGCGTATAITIVTINALPSAGTISGTTTICPTATTTLSSTVPGGVWSIGSANATVNAATGVVTGVSAGTAMISYAVSNGCGTTTATTIVTINALPSAGTISGTTAICPTATTTLGSTVPGGVWSSGSANATVNATTGVVTGITTGTAMISYAVANGCGTTTATTIITINASPSAGTISGTTAICPTATTTLSSTVPGGTWSSGSANATVNAATGVVTGITAGTAMISYAVSNSCGTTTATTIVTINASPSAGTISGPSSVLAGSTITLSDVIAGGVWSSSNSGIASVSAGAVTGNSAGTATISYTVGGICGSATATYAISVSIPVSPITGNAPVCAGSTLSLGDATAGGTWSSGNTAIATISTTGGVVTGVSGGTAAISYITPAGTATAIVTVNAIPSAISGATTACTGATATLSSTTAGGSWSSSNPGIASVNTSGVVSAIAAGTTVISYTLPTGCASSSTFTVGTAPAAISGPAYLCAGSTATFSNSGGGTWSSSTPTVVNINSATGAATAGSSGTAVISCTAGSGCLSTLNVTVATQPAAITGGTTPICNGATATLADATAGGTWSSSSTATATIGSVSGIVTGTGAGTVTLSYAIGSGCSRTITMTINPAPAPIAGTLSVCPGSTTVLTDPTTPGSSWTSSAPPVATINSGTGTATGIAAGTATITYTLGTSCYTTATLTVNAAPAAISGTLSVCQDATTMLANTVSGGSWSSSNTAKATVEMGSGVVSGIAAGTATLSYSTGAGCVKTAIVTVNAAPSAIGGTLTACPGGTTTLSNGTTGGTWASTNTSIATIAASTGVASGAATGTTTISYRTAAGCVATTILTVTTAPSASTGTPGICASGGTTTLTNAIAGGTWSSSNNAVASVTGTGANTALVTGGSSAGTATITYSLGGGCRATNVITVNALPSLISGATTACAGISATLTNSYNGGIWSSSNPATGTITAGANAATGIFAPLSTGTTVISYTYTATGCGRSTTLSVIAALDAGTISGPATIHLSVSPTVTLASSGDAGGTWTSNATTRAQVNATTGVVTGMAAGSALISYTVSNAGCSVRSTYTITVSATRPGSSMAAAGAADVRLYPNPTQGALHIEGRWGEGSEPVSIAVSDMAGQSIWKAAATTKDGLLDESVMLPPNMANGIYMLHLHSGSRQQVFQFVVGR